VNEIRRDYILDRWVIIASERAKRPKDFVIEEKKIQKALCPFCPEYIEMPIVYKDSEPWNVAVIPNKYPALRPEIPLRIERGMFESMGARGFHEIVIETPEHEKNLEDLPVEHIYRVLKVFSDRTKLYMSREDIQYVSIFKNHGVIAGESISHEHSQLIALPVVPELIKRESEKSERFEKEVGICPFKAIYLRERRTERLLFEMENFFVLAPFASIFPAETWIVAKKHVETMDQLRKNELMELAEILKRTLKTIKKIFPGVPYNLVIHQSAKGSRLHLHIEIYPRLSIHAGFELGNNMYINVLPPEVYAKEFRRVMVA